ncbi:MAG: ATP-binding cassette domain-containing protein [Bacteroidetes bacterium]|nr:ATP-binding cassette domain-containing protein [Bacteroidota bacterium]
MIRFSLHKKLKASTGDMQLDVECHIDQGKLVTLFGESGAGKTSILRMLAGLLMPEKGTIEVNNSVWLDTQKGINLKPQQRKTGYVFQDYALFPNMTVKENLEYALDKNQDIGIVKELIEIIELTDLQDRKPETLSGGQKQRIALARALVRQPQILMLDEPLSALDRAMRTKLQDYILHVHRKYNLTTILVSHEMSEIFKLSDEILVLENGTITRQGTPMDIFTNRHISGKFQFTGEILHIEKEDIIYIISVLIGNNLVKVVADQSEVQQFSIGEKVLVASKAFNPMIEKINH